MGVILTQREKWQSMTRLNDTALKAELKKAREAQEEIVDSAVPGLVVRVGRGLAATWSLVLRVRGEGGVSRRGFEKKGRRYRLSLGTYPAMSLEAARARANEFIAQATWCGRDPSGHGPAGAVRFEWRRTPGGREESCPTSANNPGGRSWAGWLL